MARNTRPSITARKRVWLDTDGTRIPGIGLMRGEIIHAHLTPVEARTLADHLHDLADKLEAGAAEDPHRKAA